MPYYAHKWVGDTCEICGMDLEEFETGIANEPMINYSCNY